MAHKRISTIKKWDLLITLEGKTALYIQTFHERQSCEPDRFFFFYIGMGRKSRRPSIKEEKAVWLVRLERHVSSALSLRVRYARNERL